LFGLKKSAHIIEVCMLLHNFIVDARDAEKEDSRFFHDFAIRIDKMQEERTSKTG
jgi:hypothetical protein